MWVSVNPDADEGAGSIVPAVSGDRLQVDVLGPIRARDPHGRDVTPDGVLQRRLLALLVLRRGQRRVGGCGDRRAVAGRAAAGSGGGAAQPPVPAPPGPARRRRSSRRASGYRLDAVADRPRRRPPGRRAERAASRRIPPSATIDDVLERWHGPAYPELDDVDDGRAEAVRLAELRIRAVEARAECRLAAGDTDGLVAELAALADEEPLRERPRALLMAALAGRAARRGAAGLRRLPAAARRRARHRAVAGAGRPARRPARVAPAPAAWAPASRLPVPVDVAGRSRRARRRGDWRWSRPTAW